MLGIIVAIVGAAALYYWYSSGGKDRSDIIVQAKETLDDAKAARQVAKINAETKEVLAEANEINKQ